MSTLGEVVLEVGSVRRSWMLISWTCRGCRWIQQQTPVIDIAKYGEADYCSILHARPDAAVC